MGALIYYVIGWHIKLRKENTKEPQYIKVATIIESYR